MPRSPSTYGLTFSSFRIYLQHKGFIFWVSLLLGHVVNKHPKTPFQSINDELWTLTSQTHTIEESVNTKRLKTRKDANPISVYCSYCSYALAGLDRQVGGVANPYKLPISNCAATIPTCEHQNWIWHHVIEHDNSFQEIEYWG
jgi:hypothetical protein